MSDASGDSAVERLAHLLVAARQSKSVAPDPGETLVPPNETDAQAVDDRVAELLGRPIVGWKIGCTSALAQELLEADGPFPGRIYDRYRSGDALAADMAGSVYVEGEIVFRLGADLAPTAEVQRDTVIAAIDATWPAIELVGGRFGDLFHRPLNLIIADAGSNRGVVVPDPADVTTIDPSEAKDLPLEMAIDGVAMGSGTGRDILGDPIDALTWLAQRLADRGIILEAGQLVSVGTATGAVALEPGTTARLTIDGLGDVEIIRPLN